jgi:PPK2 family polyphosphate:nucleotide phosphotransferase
MKISDLPTFNKEWNKDETEKKTKKILKEIGELQYKMYAQNRYSIIVVLQGTDASGKDGLTKGLLRYCNPIGLEVYSFKKPTDLEYAHDFLWRIHQVCPANGVLQVFIRSHYEDILVPSVEKYIPAEVIDKRYEMINTFEKLLESNGTKVLKFFLNVSKEAQKERLMERIELREKHWKHKDSDWDTREKYDEYMKVYQKILTRCNDVPWTVVPADKNWQKLYAVAVVVLKTLKELDLQWPELVTEKFKAPVKQPKEVKSQKSGKSVKSVKPAKSKVTKVPKV